MTPYIYIFLQSKLIPEDQFGFKPSDSSINQLLAFIMKYIPVLTTIMKLEEFSLIYLKFLTTDCKK